MSTSPPFKPGDLVATHRNLWVDKTPQANVETSWNSSDELVGGPSPKVCVHITHELIRNDYILRLLHPERGVVLSVWYDGYGFEKLETTAEEQ